MRRARARPGERHPQPVLASSGTTSPTTCAPGRALERVFESLREREPRAAPARVRLRDRLGRHARRRRLPEGAARRADRRRRGARVPDDALQRLRRAQHPGHRRQAHPAHPQRDEHRRRRRRSPTGPPTGSDVLFNTDVGRALPRATPRRARRRRRRRSPSLGLSSICNVLAAIKTAKHFGLGPDDVDRHGRHRRRGDVRDRARARRSPRDFAGRLRRGGGRRDVRRAPAGRRHRPHARARPSATASASSTSATSPGSSSRACRSRTSRRAATRRSGAGCASSLADVGRADRRVQRPRRACAESRDERAATATRSSAPAAAHAAPPGDEPYPFRCPNAGPGDDVDHVLRRELDPTAVALPAGDDEPNPFVRYRDAASTPTTCARPRAVGRASTCDARASGSTSAVAAVDGHGFAATPFAPQRRAQRAPRVLGAGGVWVKDETGNVSGSHKARHLMGVLLVPRGGRADRAGAGRQRRDLAIASCGNAALAAAVVAAAGGRTLRRLRAGRRRPGRARAAGGSSGARVTVCPREPGVARRSRPYRALARGARRRARCRSPARAT